jgi:hypothetical protein
MTNKYDVFLIKNREKTYPPDMCASGDDTVLRHARAQGFLCSSEAESTAAVEDLSS